MHRRHNIKSKNARVLPVVHESGSTAPGTCLQESGGHIPLSNKFHVLSDIDQNQDSAKDGRSLKGIVSGSEHSQEELMSHIVHSYSN